MAASQGNVLPPTTGIYDLVCAFLAGDISGELLAEILERQCGWTPAQTRDAWEFAVQRGCEMANRHLAWKHGDNLESNANRRM